MRRETVAVTMAAAAATATATATAVEPPNENPKKLPLLLRKIGGFLDRHLLTIWCVLPASIAIMLLACVSSCSCL